MPWSLLVEAHFLELFINDGSTISQIEPRDDSSELKNDFEFYPDILRYAGTYPFDIGVDIDPGNNNNLLGVVRLPGASPFQPRLRQANQVGKRVSGIFLNVKDCPWQLKKKRLIDIDAVIEGPADGKGQKGTSPFS